MQVEFLGHAGFIISHGRFRVACDPWLSPLGAFHASWFQFPCNHRLWHRDYRNLAAVVITHEHQDHLDANFLADKLTPEIPIVVPRYPSQNLRNKIRQACQNPIVEVEPGTEHVFGEGFRLLFTSEESPANQDSAVTFLSREAVLINMNDARLTHQQLETLKDRLNGRVDALLIQCSGASWYPICYRYSDKRMQALSSEKRMAKLEYAFQTLEQMAPRMAVPYAGPPAFLEDSLFQFNDDGQERNIFPDQKKSYDWLRDRGYARRLDIPLPGDRLELISRQFSPDQEIRREFSFEKKEAYLKSYADRMRPAITAYLAGLPRPTVDLFEPFRAYFQRLGKMNKYFREQVNMNLRFVVDGSNGGDFLVKCDARELTVQRTEGQSAQYTTYLDAQSDPAPQPRLGGLPSFAALLG